jgi:hypothetical protein
LQVPTEGLQSVAKPSTGGNFTLSMEVRFEKLPPKGHLQSLVRFSLPDMAQARRIHRAGLYLNGDGVVVSKAMSTGGLTTVDVEKLLKVVPEPNRDERYEEDMKEISEEEKKEDIKDNGEGSSEVKDIPKPEEVKFTTEMTTGRSRSVRHGVWHVISVVVKPSAGEVSTYVNGHLCHESNNLDPADLRLQYKLVILGGGRQAQNRGGDLRRITIHSKDFNASEIKELYCNLADENPAIGGRAVRIQAAFRGYSKRLALNRAGHQTKFSREAAAMFEDAMEERSCDY